MIQSFLHSSGNMRIRLFSQQVYNTGRSKLPLSQPVSHVTCCANVWAMRLQDRLANKRLKSRKPEPISGRIGARRDLWLSPLAHSLTNSWLSVSNSIPSYSRILWPVRNSLRPSSFSVEQFRSWNSSWPGSSGSSSSTHFWSDSKPVLIHSWSNYKIMFGWTGTHI